MYRIEVVDACNGYYAYLFEGDSRVGVACLGDGVDWFLTDEDSDSLPEIGTEEFRLLIERDLNTNIEVVMEAYFPEVTR